MLAKLLVALCLAGAAARASDEITVYDLLPPDTHQFAIIYDVTQTREGAPFFFNPIRQGAIATKERVVERSTGKELKFEVVSGKEARDSGWSPRALDSMQYIKVILPGPVPKNGETRIRILKTYTDAKSYYADGDQLVFDRPLGIRRNVVILPAGYELTASASPAIVSTQADGRVKLSFLNDRDDQLPVKITARKVQ
jgi:hypothetical protein